MSLCLNQRLELGLSDEGREVRPFAEPLRT